MRSPQPHAMNLEKLDRALDTVGCAHCDRRDAGVACPHCGHVICEACHQADECPYPHPYEIRFPVGSRLRGLDPEGRWALVQRVGLDLWDLDASKKLRKVVEVRPRGLYMTPMVWRLLPGGALARRPYIFAFNRRNRHAPSCARYFPAGGGKIKKLRLDGPSTSLWGMSDGGRVVLVGLEGGGIALIDSLAWTGRSLVPHSFGPRYVVTACEATNTLGIGTHDYVILMDMDTGASRGELLINQGAVNCLKMGRDVIATTTYIGGRRQLALFRGGDATWERLASTAPMRGNFAERVALSLDGRFVAAAQGNSVEVIDLVKDEKVQVLRHRACVHFAFPPTVSA